MEKNPNKMSLIIKGARQVGKTFIIDKFARENYENYIYINFIENSKYKAIFDGDLDIENIIKQMTLRIPNLKIVSQKTIIFLDEIQNCPNARTAIKFLSIDKRFDVIASGSLLGINYKEVDSFPVGYTEQLEIHSLDFEDLEKTKARACFKSIPKHLAKDYKKFRYSLVTPSGSSRKYEGSLMGVYDAGIINFFHNLSLPELPFEGNSISEAMEIRMVLIFYQYIWQCFYKNKERRLFL